MRNNFFANQRMGKLTVATNGMSEVTSAVNSLMATEDSFVVKDRVAFEQNKAHLTDINAYSGYGISSCGQRIGFPANFLVKHGSRGHEDTVARIMEDCYSDFYARAEQAKDNRSSKSLLIRSFDGLIAGVLTDMQIKIFQYMEMLESGEYTHAQLEGIIRFMRDDLGIRNPELKKLEDADLVIYMKKKLNRPIRVCGMVKNVGEPGGGPFLAYNTDGTISLQILESSQIDKSNTEYVRMFKEGTHFNPVDLVCGIKDYKGNKFNLPDFVDPQTGFISYKSKDGKELKALELPGLWNGAMSDWNTIFVEVPLSTFNPVKTVNDLLREQHQ